MPRHFIFIPSVWLPREEINLSAECGMMNAEWSACAALHVKTQSAVDLFEKGLTGLKICFA
jgi:hypothetical protein